MDIKKIQEFNQNTEDNSTVDNKGWNSSCLVLIFFFIFVGFILLGTFILFYRIGVSMFLNDFN